MPETVKAVFRRDRGGIVFAMFPYDIATHEGHCTCYEHVGQHSAADYTACIATSRPAKPDEYAPLLRELETRGYNVQVIKRRNRGN
jgi:hypothetical protein